MVARVQAARGGAYSRGSSQPDRRTVGGAAALAVLMVCMSDAGADPPSPVEPPRAASSSPAESAANPEVIIQGKRDIERQVRGFVSGITRVNGGPTSEASLTRWNDPICPLVAGLPRSQGEFILARLSQIATAAGAPLAGPHCQANLYVIATHEPGRLLKLWNERDHRLFGNGEPPAKIDRFFNTERPVRVWYNADLTSWNGVPMVAGDFGGLQENHHPKDSRLEHSAVQRFASVLTVVDLTRVEGVQLGYLADYIAMIALTQLDLDAEVGALRRSCACSPRTIPRNRLPRP